MKIIVDETEIELDLPQKDIVLKEVISEVEDFLFEVGKIPISLAINGQQLSQEELETREGDLLEGNEILTFGVQTIFEFIDGSMEGVTQANKELMNKIREFAAAIHSDTTHVTGGELIEEINNFFEFWYKLQRLVPDEVGGMMMAGKGFNQWFEELRSLFEEIVAAMEERDFVLAADLLQYEVVPSVEALHQAIPILRSKVMARNGGVEE